MPLRQKRPGVSYGGGGGGGQKPLLNFINAFNTYDPNAKIIEGQSESDPAQIQLDKPNWFQRLDPSAMQTYRGLKNDFELSQFQASQEMAQRLRAIQEMAANQERLERLRTTNNLTEAERQDQLETRRQEAKVKADQTAAQAKAEAEAAQARQNLYLKNMENERKNELDMTAAEKAAALKDGIGDFATWRQYSEPVAKGKFQLADRSNRAILQIPDPEYNQAEQTKFFGDAEKQSVTNAKTKMDTLMAPILQLGPDIGAVHALTGQSWINRAPQKDEYAMPNGGIFISKAPVKPSEGVYKTPGGINAKFGQGQDQPQQAPQATAPTKPIFIPPAPPEPPLQGPAAPPSGEPYGLNPFNDPWMQQMGRDMIPSILQFEDKLNPSLVNWLRNRGTLGNQ